MKGLVCIALVALLGGVSSGASPQEKAKRPWPAKLTVFVEHNGSDSMGARLAFQVREMIRNSQGYTLADSEESTGSTIMLITRDVPCNQPEGLSAFYWTLKTNTGVFATTSAIGLVSEGSIKRSAEGVLAMVDSFFVRAKTLDR
jgi:hypothetical protein